MNSKTLEKICPLSPQNKALLSQAIDKLKLSARAYHRILKVARTIADLEGSPELQTAHITEAISYRRFDNQS